MTLIDISLCITGAALGSIMFILITMASNLRANKSYVYIIALLGLLIPMIISYHLGATANVDLIMAFLPLCGISLLAIGPLLYDYSQYIYGQTDQVLAISKRNYYPMLLATVLLLGAKMISKDSIFQLTVFLVTITGIGMCVYYLVRISKSRKEVLSILKNFYARYNDKDLQWIDRFIIAFIVLLLLDSLSGLIVGLTGQTLVTIFNNGLMLLLTWYLGFHAIQQKSLSNAITEMPKPENSSKEHSIDCGNYEELIRKTIREKELHKVEDVNLRMLAAEVDLPVKNVSQIINHCLDTTFYELMNSYRIMDFKAAIENGDQLQKTILAIAYDSGFNSKATFNRVFKQIEGKTPNQYVKSVSSLKN